MPDRVRITLDLDGATTYRSERVEDPPRVLFDMPDTQPGPPALVGTRSLHRTVPRATCASALQPNHVTRVVVEPRRRRPLPDLDHRSAVSHRHRLRARAASGDAADRAARPRRNPRPRRTALLRPPADSRCPLGSSSAWDVASPDRSIQSIPALAAPARAGARAPSTPRRRQRLRRSRRRRRSACGAQATTPPAAPIAGRTGTRTR